MSNSLHRTAGGVTVDSRRRAVRAVTNLLECANQAFEEFEDREADELILSAVQRVLDFARLLNCARAAEEEE